MLIKDTFHLTYCTNIHAGGDWQQTLKSLKENLPTIKTKVAPDSSFGLGLRLSNKASLELNQADNLNRFKSYLASLNCYVFTMNGFPYGNFHGEPVKDQVHVPDWTTDERVTYTLRLFNQLHVLAPEGQDAGISTSPISYKHWYSSGKERVDAFAKGTENMLKVVLELYNIEQTTGRYLHLDVEPEPDGFLENTKDVLHWYKTYVIPQGIAAFSYLNITEKKAIQLLKRYLTICYDVCHFALAFEEPEDTLRQLKTAGIQIGKIQISAALKVVHQAGKENQIWEELAKFNEPVYLHQVTERVEGKVKTYNDLPIVLKEKKAFTELRSHFHVPIFLEDYGVLQSTQDHILKTLQVLKEHPVSGHLEVETYTWDVLPKDLKLPIADSIVRELNWMKSRLE
ncbi:metabolite traffic protein EboE [Croceivirga sp. JEA036]|uniref:metabolite traffic protein EboE n=1 Tax=Croceivirga sp. JEA036 TaxID=2721162 RepID=UPI00143C5DDC|nr:metabolite traffic protein EboE [Croceivirga sp. JEA036]NJB35037.1 metabolite traffic protein EboE [Croceivirga sp. JEA036]